MQTDNSIVVQLASNLEQVLVDESTDEYDLNKGEPIFASEFKLILKIDKSFSAKNITRFSCACHKINLAVRKAVLEHEEIRNLLNEMKNYVKSAKLSHNFSRILREHKTKLRCENLTRWGSSFLMILSFLKANKAGVFHADNPFPFNLKDLQIYFQILLPVFKLNLVVESTEFSIADFLPYLTLTVNGILSRMVLRAEKSSFRNLLVNYLKEKFSFECNSKLYLAAAFLNPTKIFTWHNRSFCKNLADEAYNAVNDAALIVFKNEKIKLSEKNNKKDLVVGSQAEKEIEDFFDEFSKSVSLQDIAGEASNKELYDEITKEKAIYLTLIKETKITRDFWVLNRKKIPNLASLALRYIFKCFKITKIYSLVNLRLSNIPASSAFIERFFSICGVICTQRNTNMAPDLLRIRSLLKANFQLLKEISS